MRFPEQLLTASDIRRFARTLRRTARETPACAAGFGALIGGLAATSLLSQLGEARFLLDAIVPSWVLVVGAEAIGAAMAWAKIRNPRWS